MEAAQDFSIKDAVVDAIAEIERRAQAWEFNNKNLMYTPASSNWAEERPIEGYILLNNALRYWMLTKVPKLLSTEGYAKKAQKVLAAVKYHFFGEPAEVEGLFTASQLNQIKRLQAGDRVLISFTPGVILNHIDTLGWSLTILLGVSSESTTTKMAERLSQEMIVFS